ncbi:MAG: response regulator [Deltaproteobacteria bacterium]|nr:response regulator [Deltaproteobacteria bacterium]MBW2532973.1 response regulator [Deltaproteobacteria bacterium]
MPKQLDVLIIDDEEIVCKRLKPSIERMGCHVETFMDPVAALARIDEKEFDVVVSDVRMEEVDGIQILEHVQAKSAHTKVIIITGYAMMALAREAMHKGAFDFVSKPFKPADIRKVIGEAAAALKVPLDWQEPVQGKDG